MDFVYYWKAFSADRKAGRIGWLPASRKKLDELRERQADFVWAFNSPPARKGVLVPVARLLVSDVRPKATPKDIPLRAAIYYDPSSAESLRFHEVDEEQIVELNVLLRTRFPNAYRSNFTGDYRVSASEADVSRALIAMSAGWRSEPFVNA